MRWFYVDEGRRNGPVTLDELLDRLLKGHLACETPVWHAGLPGWVKAHTVPEIAAELPPPVAGAARPAAADAPPGLKSEVAEEPWPSPEVEAPSGVVEDLEGRHRHHRIRPHRSKSRWHLVLLAVVLVVLVLVLWRIFRQADTIPSGIIGLGRLTSPRAADHAGRLRRWIGDAHVVAFEEGPRGARDAGHSALILDGRP